MQWHEYRPSYKAIAKALGYGGTPRQQADAAIAKMRRSSAPAIATTNTICQLDAEACWVDDGRPYYDLYPSVAEAFSKIDLTKVPCENLRMPLPELLIRMPVGHEFWLSARTKFRSVLVREGKVSSFCSIKGAKRGWSLSLDVGENIDVHGTQVPMHTITGVVMEDGGNIEQSLARGRKENHDSTCDDEAVTTIYKIIATLCLLKNDPDLIEPEPLEADREKWERDHSPALIEKAERRGKRAWSVGKHIEVAPGFRRPHFAVRWCGKGRHDPRVRPIKGCLVRRREITEVPTDWLGPEIPTEAAHVV